MSVPPTDYKPRGMQSHPLGDRTRREPHGEVTLAQMNRFLQACLYQEEPELTHYSTEAELAMAFAQKRVMHLGPDPLYKMLQEELEKRVAPEIVEQVEAGLPTLRQSFAYALHKAIATDGEVSAMPQTWEQMHHRGILGQGAFRDWVKESYPDQQEMVDMLCQCYGQVWYRLEQMAFGDDGKVKAPRRGKNEQITTRQWDAMRQIPPDDLLPIARRMIGDYLEELPVRFDKQDQLEFITQQCDQYLRGQLTPPEKYSAFPETWGEFNQRIADGKDRWLPFVEERSQDYNINLVGHEKELLAIYDAVAAHFAHVGRHALAEGKLTRQ